MIEKKTWSRRPDIYGWNELMQYMGSNRAYKYFEGNIWLFTHNLGSLSLIADAWVTDETKEANIELINITILDINTVKFEFNGNAKGYGTVLSVIDQQGSGKVLEQKTLSQQWELDHNLNTIGTISDIWVDNPLVRVIDYSTDYNKVYVTFDRPAKGAVIMALVDNSVAQDLSVYWNQISGKPSEYPPSPHTHNGVDIESAVADSNCLGGIAYTQYLRIGNIGTDIPPLDAVTKKIPLQYLPASMQLLVGTTEKDYMGKYYPLTTVPAIRFNSPLFSLEINADNEAEVHIDEYIHSIQLYGNVPPGMAADVRPNKNNNRIQIKAGEGLGMKCDPASPSLLELYSLDSSSLFWQFNRELQPQEFWEIENSAFSLDVSKTLFNIYAYVSEGTEKYIWNPRVTATTISDYFNVISSSQPVDDFLYISEGKIQYKIHAHQGYTVKTVHSDISVTVPSTTQRIFDLYVNGNSSYYVGKNSIGNLQIVDMSTNTVDNTPITNIQYAYFEYPNVVYIKRDNVTFDILVYEYNILTKTTENRRTIYADQLGFTDLSYVYYYREYQEDGTVFAYVGERQNSSLYKIMVTSSLPNSVYSVPPNFSLDHANFIKLANNKWAIIINNKLYGIGDLDNLQNTVTSNTLYDDKCVALYCPSFDNVYFLTSSNTLFNFIWEDQFQAVYKTGTAILQMKDSVHTSYKIPSFLNTVHAPIWTGEGDIKVGIFDFQHPNVIHTVQDGEVSYISPEDVPADGMPLNEINSPITFNNKKSLGVVVSMFSNDSATCPYIDLSPQLHGFLGERYILNPEGIQVSIFNSYCVLYNKTDTPIGPILVVKK